MPHVKRHSFKGYRALASLVWLSFGGSSCTLIGYPELDREPYHVSGDAGENNPGSDAGRTQAERLDGSGQQGKDGGRTPLPDDGGSDPQTIDGGALRDAATLDADLAPDAADPAEDPIEFPSDDGGAFADAGTSSDAGINKDAGRASDASVPDAGVATCAGAPALGLCWYLGGFGMSCDQACASHGGFDSRAVSYVGTSSQGGSLTECRQVLSALGLTIAPYRAYRLDAYALACHVWYTGTTYWLDDPSAYFRSWSSGPYARIACGCLR